ncbi:NAD(P)-dependent alcohol dehydrogenase [Streptomyces sp. NPDC001922]|uniref:NAD(P)-dependent alcohol dehydrogenase n=1 Tax=Streptomyces sp. NPDC001922 TaxID=3364624 RepID=UPI0036BD7FE7
MVEHPGGPFTIHELDLDTPRRDEILVKVTAAGVCHTDLSMRQVWPEPRLPMVFGHEAAGVVEAVGESVTTVTPGDTVCLTFRSCGHCSHCTQGVPAYCEDSSVLNGAGTRPDGSTPLRNRSGKPVYGSFFGQSSFASHCIAYESNTVKIPADLPPAVAAPLGCSVQTGVGTVVNVLRPAKGETLVVFGAGSVGLSAVMGAVATGCTVVAVDPIASRRALALELGAATAIDPARGDVAAAARDATGSAPGYAIDTTGQSSVISQAISTLRRRGELILVGIGTAEFPTTSVMVQGLRIRGVIEGDAAPHQTIPYLIDLYRQGRLPLEKLITEYAFTEIESATQDAASGRAIKPVLIVG